MENSIAQFPDTRPGLMPEEPVKKPRLRLITQRLGKTQIDGLSGNEEGAKPDKTEVVRRFGRSQAAYERIAPARAIWHRREIEREREYQIPVTVIGVRDCPNGEFVFEVEDSPVLGDWSKNGIPSSELQWPDETDEGLELTGEGSLEAQTVETQMIVEDDSPEPEEVVQQTDRLEPEISWPVPEMRLQPTRTTPELVGRISEVTRDGSRRVAGWWRVKSSEYRRGKNIDKRTAVGAIIGAAALVTAGYIGYKYKAQLFKTKSA